MTIETPQNGSSGIRRRWLRFSLRTLLIVMTVVAVWLGFTMKRLRDQERAVARIGELGGTVEYDYQFDVNRNSIPNADPPGPQWLRRIFGPQWNVEVVGVMLDRLGRATDDDLKLVGRFTELRSLSIVNCPSITDSGLSQLSNLSKLRVLTLVRCNVNGSGLTHLKYLPIDFLNLQDNRIADVNLEHLSSMTRLLALTMQEPAITSRGLVHLKGLTNLFELNLSRTAVDDEGLVHLKGLTKLKSLNLTGTKVTDDGVAKLKPALPNLELLQRKSTW